MDIIFLVKKGNKYLAQGDAEAWVDDWLEAREFTDEREAEAVAAKLGARVMAVD